MARGGQLFLEAKCRVTRLVSNGHPQIVRETTLGAGKRVTSNLVVRREGREKHMQEKTRMSSHRAEDYGLRDPTPWKI